MPFTQNLLYCLIGTHPREVLLFYPSHRLGMESRFACMESA